MGVGCGVGRGEVGVEGVGGGIHHQNYRRRRRHIVGCGEGRGGAIAAQVPPLTQ